MILSASRRTDIPAFYSEWMVRRLQAGYVLVPSPRNPSRFSRVKLNPQVVDCIVFWTKNPAPILPRLGEIFAMGYSYYFQFTLTPYGRDMEPHLPPKRVLLQTFRSLSKIVGGERVVWRYDPVILTEHMDIKYHLHCFEKMATALEGYTQRCIFSFLDLYPRVRKCLQDEKVNAIPKWDMLRLAEGFSEIAQKHGLQLFTCCEPVDLGRYGIAHASCIDAGVIQEIIGCSIRAKKDAKLRPGCGCMESVEIGAYDSCGHGCKYCYATSSWNVVRHNMARHHPMAPVLFGHLPESAEITEGHMISMKDAQVRLWD
jgi:DNA repair photolyase